VKSGRRVTEFPHIGFVSEINPLELFLDVVLSPALRLIL